MAKVSSLAVPSRLVQGRHEHFAEYSLARLVAVHPKEIRVARVQALALPPARTGRHVMRAIAPIQSPLYEEPALRAYRVAHAVHPAPAVWPLREGGGFRDKGGWRGAAHQRHERASLEGWLGGERAPTGQEAAAPGYR